MKKQLFTLLTALLVVIGMKAQTNIANYTFSKSLGTYVTLGSPTILGVATGTTNALSMDAVNYQIAMPSGFTFFYGGVPQTSLNINGNGYVGFSSGIWTGQTTNPLTNTPAGGTTTGIIAGFARDLNAIYNPTASVVGDISYELLGSAPNRKLVVQFKNFKPFTSALTDPRVLNFQIVLYESTHTTMANQIEVVYGNCIIGTSTATDVRVGIRGNSTTWTDNINSLTLLNNPTTTTCNWSDAVTSFSTTAANVLLFTSTNTNIAIPNGLVYNWAPSISSSSLAPVRSFTNVTNITNTQAALSWLAPTGATQYFVEYRMPNSCAWTSFVGNPISTNSVTLNGLTPASIYQVRVKSSDGTNQSIWSHIPNNTGSGEGYSISAGTFSTAPSVDLQALKLASPFGCVAPTMPVVVEIKNTGFVDLDFSSNNAVVSVAVTGANPQTFTTTLTSGTLTVGSTQQVTLTTNYNMSAFGSYVFNATAKLTVPDLTTSNDAIPATTVNNQATFSLPYAQDFQTATTPANWTNTSSWSFATSHGLTTNGIYNNLYSSVTSAQFDLLKLGSIVGNEIFTFDYRVLNFSSYPTGGVPTGAWGNFKVQVSTNCGSTFTDLATIDNTTHTVTTQAWTNKVYSLSAFAGQNIVVRVLATWLSGDYFIDIDNINIANCFPPTAVLANGISTSTTSISWTAPSLSTPSNYIYEVRSSGVAGSGTLGLASSGTVAAPTNSVAVTGLNPANSYSIYVISSCGVGSSSVWTPVTTFTTTSLLVDLQTTSLISPIVSATGCYATTPIVIQIKNAGTTALDFSANNAIVYGAVTGSNPQTFTTVVSTGTLAANATRNVTLTTAYDMSAVGVYSLNAISILAIPDANTSNDIMAQATRTTLAADPLPYSQDFPTTTAPAGWNTTGWSIASNHGLTTNGIYKNMWSSATTGTFSLLKLGTVVGNESFAFDYRVLNYNLTYPGTVTVPSGSVAAWGNFKVQVSGDCGSTYTDLATIDNTTHTVTTQGWTNKVYSLSAFAGQNIIVRVVATWVSGDYFIDIDNINVASCFVPTAVLINTLTPTGSDVSWTAPSLSIPASYIYEVRSSGAVGSGTTGLATTGTITAPSTSVSVSGLTASTVYSVYVMSSCGVGSSSVWTPAKTFTTLCTPAVAPTAANSSQCGFGVSLASVTGGTTYLWYATPTSTTALQTSTLTTYTTAIGSTTTFYVSNNDGTCLSPRVPVTTTVSIPESVMASATATALCPGSSTVLLSVNQATGTVYSFTWSASPSIGSGLVSPIANQTVSVLPTAFGSYVYQVIASDGICTTTSSVTILSSDIPAILASSSPTASCSGSDVILNAINASSGMVTIGTNTNTTSSTSYPTAFGNYWYQTWQQYLYTAAELKAMGLVAGNISSIAFNIATTPSPNSTLTDYNVKVAATSNTVLTAFTTTGLTNAFGPAAVTAVVGVNTINFSTPYNWDGNSNLIIDLRQTEFFGNGNATTYYTTTPNNSVLYAYATSSDVNYWTSNPTPTPSSSRPNIKFGGIVATSNPPISWQWNPGALTGSSVTVNPINSGTAAITVNYTVSATNTITGCSNTATTSVLVNPLPSPVVATNATQCGNGIPTASVTGGTSYNWYATATSTTVLQSGTATNFTSAIGATTSWFVTNFNGTCESTRRQVTQTVTTPDAVMTTSSATAICIGGTYTLQAINTGTTNTYSYTWTPTPAAGSGLTSGVTGSTQVVSPTVAGNYDYLVTAFDGVCTTTASAMVTVNGLPTIFTSSNPTVVCSGSVVNLDAQSVAASAGTATVGAQTTTGITGGPYRQGAGSDNKAQYLFTAAELTAAGYSQGNITGLSFNVTSNGIGTMNNFVIKMGNTVSNTLGTTYDAAPPVVFGPIAYTTIAGLNTHTFSTPFYWNGTSNVIVEVCHDVVSGGSSSSISQQTTTNKVIYSNTTGACALTSGTSGTNLPVISFFGQVGTNINSTMNFVWNPGAINSNTAMVNPVNSGTAAITMIYTVSVTNTLTSCSNTATTSVVVNPLPTSPLVSNGTQCGNGVPTASVSGGTAYNWYATATSTAVLQAGTSNNYTASIGSTTTWFVSSYNGICESPRVMVTQSVTIPDAITAAASATAICPNGMVNLTATNTGTMYTYSYSWYAQPVSGSGMLTSQTGSMVSVMPTLAGTYAYVLTGVDGICTTTAVVNVLVNATPNLVASATPTMICSGAAVNLNSINGNVGTVAIGTGTTTTSSTGITPYSSNYEGSREQYLITAAELQAANLAAGDITSLAFKVTSLGSGTFAQSKFTVKIAHTADASLANAYGTPMGSFVNVYGPIAQPLPSLGTNMYTFSSPFNWDGVSNILVDICHDNDINATCSSCFSSNSAVQTSTTSYNSVWGSYADNAQSCGVQASNTISTYINRPNMIFGGVVAQNSPVVYQWNPGAINSNTAMVNPINTGTVAVTNVYTVTVTNTLTSCGNSATVAVVVNPYPVVMATSPSSVICANYNTTLTATGATSYTWMPAGGSAANAVVSPSAATIYTVTGTTAGCSSTATVSINTNPSPTITVASSATSAVCPATSVTLTATGVATTYTWNPAISTTSTAIVSPNSTSVYTVMAEDLGCITTKTISVSVGLNPIVLLASTNSVICSGSTAASTINVTGTAVSFTWTPAVSTTTMAVVSPTTPTSYVVVGSSTLGCVTSKTISINVVNTPTLMVTPQSAPICAGSSATITSTGNATSYTWSPVGGNSSSAVVTPTGSTSSYTLTGENNGCSNTSVVTLTVSALPVVNASSSPTVICLGQSATLSATTTASSYSWSNGANTISTVVTPTANASYVLTVSNGTCSSSTSVSVAVSSCIGVQELSANGISIYPNPTTDKLNIDINTDLVNNAKISIVDALGKLVISETLTSEKTVIRTTNLDTGIYFVRIISNNTEIRVEKLIKQ